MLSHPTTCGSFQPHVYRAQRGSAIRASPRVIIPLAKAVPECSHSGTVTRGGSDPYVHRLAPIGPEPQLGESSLADNARQRRRRRQVPGTGRWRHLPTVPGTSLAAKQRSRRLCPAFPQRALGQGRAFVKRWGDRPCQPWELAWCPLPPNDPHRSNTWFPWQSRRKGPRPLCSSEQP